ncbi:MAG: hypothetical protein Ct9H300mP3_11640 [Gammaproteobacteria bacterium]|nr:MAG: hypothetical protein Ct9H300mP3_11640 [Gammaproteobacteria bacterium]
MYELANRLEIHSISKDFFSEIVLPLTVFLILLKIEVDLISFVSPEVRVQGKQPYLSLYS